MRYFFAILGVFLLASAAHAPLVFALDIEVSGAGTTAVNGCYTDQGMGSIGHTWKLDDTHWIISAGIVSTYIECRITDDGDDTYPQSGVQYYYKRTPADVACTSANAAGGTYSIGTGASAAPTVTETTCPPRPDPPSPAATSTVEQTQQNLSTAVVVFFVSMFGMIWLIRKH